MYQVQLCNLPCIIKLECTQSYCSGEQRAWGYYLTKGVFEWKDGMVSAYRMVAPAFNSIQQRLESYIVVYILFYCKKNISNRPHVAGKMWIVCWLGFGYTVWCTERISIRMAYIFIFFVSLAHWYCTCTMRTLTCALVSYSRYTCNLCVQKDWSGKSTDCWWCFVLSWINMYSIYNSGMASFTY